MQVKIVKEKIKTRGNRLYTAYMSMRSRCNSPTCSDYPYYGGRGISICSEWDSFAMFELWAKTAGYLPGLTLDREDNNGNYTPSNCRWVDRATQARNRNPFSNKSSSYVGVSWNKQYSKWNATICVNRKPVHIGRFSEEADAAKARDAYVIEHGLVDYTLNFPKC